MRWLNLFKANLRKEYLELRRYLPNTLAMIITFYVIFLGMFAGIQLIGDPSSQDVNTQYVIVNYIFWFLAMMVVNNIGWEITNEAMRGTLEQLCMSPMGMWRIMVTRLFSSTIVNIFMIVALLYLSMLTTGQSLNIDLVALIPILSLSLVSMFGLGFIIAGMSIILKQVQAFLQILQFILAGLTFVPLSTAPFLAYFPFVKGVDMVREVMINGATITQLGAGDFIILTVNGVVYFIVGLLVFLYCENVAMKKGLLAHY
ncbi:ABC transporter permease [Oceanobacillus sp. M65]|uniref:ABC transporter permease n=1 Tax=Oceanobacillus sp. M65 TaxID=3457435 RepID=UPI003FCDF669